MNTTIQEALLFRHACKDFLVDKKISDEDFETILSAAHLSPSSFGFEPWKFLVIQDTHVREELAKNAWWAEKQLPHSSHFVIILARRWHHLTPHADYLQSIMKEVKQMPDNVVEMMTGFVEKFQKEDFKLTTDEKRFDWAKRQTYIPLANMMHSAALLGIDSCPMEGFHEDNINATLAEHAGVDLDIYGVSVMVAFGYRTEDPKRGKTRRDRDEVVQYI